MNAKISQLNHHPCFSLFAGMLVLCIAPPFANGQEKATGEDPLVQQVASTYYANKYHVDLNEAERRISIQDRAAGIEEDIASVLGDQFAGIWYDEDDGGKLKIGMTPAVENRADDVRRVAERYDVSADTDLVTVRFTQAELEQKQDDVRKRIADIVDAGHARTSYNTKLNMVVVTAVAKLPPPEEARVNDLTKGLGITVRRVDVPMLRGKLVACNVTFCNPPFRGGRGIRQGGDIDPTSNFPFSDCTAAFVARDNTNPSQLWVLTAGHCIFFAGFPWEAKDEANKWSVVGFSAFASFSGAPGKDAGKISISSTSNGGGWATPTALPAVVVKSSANLVWHVWDGGLPSLPLVEIVVTTYNPNYEITATSWSSIGQVLCRTGMMTGTECGAVSELGADESSVGPDGKTYTFKDMGEINVCGAKNGDSGGPLYKAHRAYGMLSSTLDDPCFEAYQGVHGAETALNVKVILAP
jgi:hypothetical protein